MKVLLVNTSECRGGAAVACHRLLEALRKKEIHARMLVRDKASTDAQVVSVNRSFWKKGINRFRFLWERFVIWNHNRFSRRNLFAVSLADTGTDISRLPEVQEADIIHIHWVNCGFLSLSDIGKLMESGKPLIWTMHDMWPFTGICHHSRSCEKFREGCKECPFLRFPSPEDLSYSVFQKKERLAYRKAAFIACSRWLEARAKKSKLLKDAYLKAIANPLDTSFFSPREKLSSKAAFGLSPAKHALLFGAARVSDPRKGYAYLFEALDLLSREHPELNDKIELVMLGDCRGELAGNFPYPVHFLGYLSDPAGIVTLYSASDVFVIPSLEENLPNMIMESMACGTPVVGFETGGIPEMIDHLENGYVAAYRQAADLMRGIRWVLSEGRSLRLGEKARKKVVEAYSEDKIAGLYLQVYADRLKNAEKKEV